jgi:hypothetical protein
MQNLEVLSNLYLIKSCLQTRQQYLEWENIGKIDRCSGEIEVIHLESMNEIFQDDIINTAVGILWAAGGLSAQYVVSRNEFICFWTSIMYNHPMHLNSNKHPLVSMI